MHPTRGVGLGVLGAVTLALAIMTARSSSQPLPRVPEGVTRRAAVAEAIMVRAQAVVREAKAAAGVESELETGEDQSGLIGAELTPLVTTLGSLEAKRLATSPEWARVLTIKLAQRGVGQHDAVAASFSGSFPGLNLAVTAACQVLGARLMAISSVTASTWGANQPGFTWPEIEVLLVRAGVIRPASVALSLGGGGDVGRDLEPEGLAEAERILQTSATALGVPAIRTQSVKAAVAARLALYDRLRHGRRVTLYVNVGGSDVSLGRSLAVLRARSGFLPGLPFDFSPERGVLARFAERGVPVLTLLNIRDLARRWGVPSPAGAPQ